MMIFYYDDDGGGYNRAKYSDILLRTFSRAVSVVVVEIDGNVDFYADYVDGIDDNDNDINVNDEF